MFSLTPPRLLPLATSPVVSVHGIKHWGKIAAALPTRTGKQCRERWHNQLDPAINKGGWSALEEEVRNEEL